MEEFARISRLPPYVFNIVNELKATARAKGEDIVDFGMGNPDQPPPKQISEKLAEVALRDDTHRYSLSRGIPRLRRAVTDWYKRKFDVSLDPETEAIVTIGSKEGLAHLTLATLGPGDAVLVPNPAYPIHPYGCVIAGAEIIYVPLIEDSDFFAELEKAIEDSWPKPKMLIVNFPCNPTTQCVDLPFLERLVTICNEYNMWLVHDIAYGEITFDGYEAPSVLQVVGAKEVAVEFYSLSKTYNMPGWRVGFMCGNPTLVSALSRIKSYLDYGMFIPIQVAAVTALDSEQKVIDDVCEMYKSRRDVLCDGLNSAGWQVEKPLGTMFVWAKIPEPFNEIGSLEFSKKLLEEAKVAVSPGIGFGKYGDTHVRFSLIENEHRTRQAIRNIKKMLKNS